MTEYKQCRVCLTSENDAKLLRLSANFGDKNKFFEKLFEVELLHDYKNILICDKCCALINKIHNFIDNGKHLNETYFGTILFLNNCGRVQYWPQVCRCCLSFYDLSRIGEDEPDLVPLLHLMTDIDIHDYQEKVMICCKCKKNLRLASLLKLTVYENQKRELRKRTAEIPT